MCVLRDDLRLVGGDLKVGRHILGLYFFIIYVHVKVEAYHLPRRPFLERRPHLTRPRDVHPTHLRRALPSHIPGYYIV